MRTRSAQKNAGQFAPGRLIIFRVFVQMRRGSSRILHKNTACFCTLCLVVTNVARKCTAFSVTFAVVPLAGDVDRNSPCIRPHSSRISRPPRGGRG